MRKVFIYIVYLYVLYIPESVPTRATETATSP